MDPLGDLLSFRTPDGHKYHLGVRSLLNRAGYSLVKVTPRGRSSYNKQNIKPAWRWDVFDPAGKLISTEPDPRYATIAAVNHFMEDR